MGQICSKSNPNTDSATNFKPTQNQTNQKVDAPKKEQQRDSKPKLSLKASQKNSNYQQNLSKFQTIKDNFETIEEVQNQLQSEGLEGCQLIVGIDFTKSNEWSGKESFGKNLHNISLEEQNPYQIVISAIAETLAKFDDDNLIPAYGFGDTSSKDTQVFSLRADNEPCDGLDGLVQKYKEILNHVYLSGPTSFGPLIEQACKTVIESGNQYHILLIIADGQITRGTHIQEGQYSRQELDTISMIVEASKLPLSIVMVGVGDGPWDTMEQFDDGLPQRSFDNFQFVNFTELYNQYKTHGNFQELQKDFALKALMEIPEQFSIIQSRGLERNKPQILYKHNRPPLNPPYNPQKATRTSQQTDPFAMDGASESQMGSFRHQSFNNSAMNQPNAMNSYMNNRLSAIYQNQQYPPQLNSLPNGQQQYDQFQGPQNTTHYPTLGPSIPDSRQQPPAPNRGQPYQQSNSFQYGNSYDQVPSAPESENYNQYNRMQTYGGQQMQGNAPARNEFQSMDMQAMRAQKAKNKNVEQNLICPITQEIMEDPVIAADGNTYERRAIQTWIRDHDTSPMTGEILKNKNLLPNNVIKSLVSNIDKSA